MACSVSEFVKRIQQNADAKFDLSKKERPAVDWGNVENSIKKLAKCQRDSLNKHFNPDVAPVGAINSHLLLQKYTKVVDPHCVWFKGDPQTKQRIDLKPGHHSGMTESESGGFLIEELMKGKFIPEDGAFMGQRGTPVPTVNWPKIKAQSYDELGRPAMWSILSGTLPPEHAVVRPPPPHKPNFVTKNVKDVLAKSMAEKLLRLRRKELAAQSTFWKTRTLDPSEKKQLIGANYTSPSKTQFSNSPLSTSSMESMLNWVSQCALPKERRRIQEACSNGSINNPRQLRAALEQIISERPAETSSDSANDFPYMASTGFKVTEVNPPHLRDAAIKEKGDLTVQEWESTQNARKNWNSNCQKKTTAIKHCHWSKIGLWPHACVDKHPLELAVTKDDGGIDWAAIDAADWVDPELKSKFQFRINCLYQNYFDAFRFLDIHKKGYVSLAAFEEQFHAFNVDADPMDIKKLFRCLDFGRDGVMDYEEWSKSVGFHALSERDLFQVANRKTFPAFNEATVFVGELKVDDDEVDDIKYYVGDSEANIRDGFRPEATGLRPLTSNSALTKPPAMDSRPVTRDGIRDSHASAIPPRPMTQQSQRLHTPGYEQMLNRRAKFERIVTHGSATPPPLNNRIDTLRSGSPAPKSPSRIDVLKNLRQSPNTGTNMQMRPSTSSALPQHSHSNSSPLQHLPQSDSVSSDIKKGTESIPLDDIAERVVKILKERNLSTNKNIMDFLGTL